jgi:ABC-2 type transport system ATP-binding protein
MANAGSGLTASHLHVSKKGHAPHAAHAVLVDDVSLEVKPLEIHGLVGPSGAGKTTVLEAIAGLVAASGDVSIGPVPLDREARRGFVHLAPHVDTSFARDRVRHVLSLVKAPDDLVKRLDLTAHLDERCGDVSRGVRKRVTLAVALTVQRGALLLDEPFDGLDVRETRTLIALLRTSTNERRSILVALSSTTQAEQLCDRFTLLARGRAVGAGQIHELRAHAKTHPGAALEEVLHALS